MQHGFFSFLSMVLGIKLRGSGSTVARQPRLQKILLCIVVSELVILSLTRPPWTDPRAKVFLVSAEGFLEVALQGKVVCLFSGTNLFHLLVLGTSTAFSFVSSRENNTTIAFFNSVIFT